MSNTISFEVTLTHMLARAFHISSENSSKLATLFMQGGIPAVLSPIPEAGLETFVKGLLKLYCSSFVREQGFLLTDGASYQVGSTPLLFYLESAGLVTKHKAFKSTRSDFLVGEFTKIGSAIGNTLATAIVESLPPLELIKQGQVFPWILLRKFANEDLSAVLPLKKPEGFRYDKAHQMFPVVLPQRGKSFTEFLNVSMQLDNGWWDKLTNILNYLQSIYLTAITHFYVGTRGGEVGDSRYCVPPAVLRKVANILEEQGGNEEHQIMNALELLEPKFWALQCLDRWLFQYKNWDRGYIIGSELGAEFAENYAPFLSTIRNYLGAFKPACQIVEKGSNIVPDVTITDKNRFFQLFKVAVQELIKDLSNVGTLPERYDGKLGEPVVTHILPTPKPGGKTTRDTETKNVILKRLIGIVRLRREFNLDDAIKFFPECSRDEFEAFFYDLAGEGMIQGTLEGSVFKLDVGSINEFVEKLENQFLEWDGICSICKKKLDSAAQLADHKRIAHKS